MSVWGFGIFQNDISEDVKTEYVDLLHRNMSNEDIVQKLITDYDDADESDKECFWTALAAIQWKYGRLTDSVKEKAFDYIDIALSNALVESKRKRVLTDLKAQLNTDQPAEKKVRPYRLVKTTWKNGDVYIYRITGCSAESKFYEGKFVLFRKVFESSVHPGHITPVVSVKLTEEASIPRTVEEYDKLPYCPVWKRAVPFQILDDKQNIVLWDYYINLGTISQRGVIKQMKYLDNYPDVKLPECMYTPRDHFDTPLILVESNSVKFEKRLSVFLKNSSIVYSKNSEE